MEPELGKKLDSAENDEVSANFSKISVL